MSFDKYLSALLQFFVLLPAAASCYFAAKNQMKYTFSKTALMCVAVIVPYSFFGAVLYSIYNINVNTMLFPSLIAFFFIYRRTVTIDLPKVLAIYVGVCAVQTFPAQFAYSLDARLNPLSGAADMSVEAALFQFILSCLIVAAFIYPACKIFPWTVDNLDFPKIWYFITMLSLVFLIFNVLSVPRSYSTLHAGRISYLFPLLEVCSLTLLIVIYVLFYSGSRIILEYSQLKERSQLFEMQEHQYRTIYEHMKQRSRLRHDFRHSVRLLSSLANKNDIESIKTHLAEYESRISENTPTNYCSNSALNALFGYYHDMAVSAAIDTDWQISLPDILTVSELDMAGLFGNIMENAISGCSEVSETQRYFCLTADVRNGNNLYVVSTNSFGGKVRKSKNGYLSTRHSGKGTGLVSISAIAEKYHGSARAYNSDKEFFVDVVLKL